MKVPGWLARKRPSAKELAVALDTPIHEVRYVVLDTELTSLDRKSNRLLSIGAIAMEGPRIRLREQFYRVVNPEVSVPASSVLIHGLRPADVEGGEPPLAVLGDLRAFVHGAVLVGHFVEIDTAILRKEVDGGGPPLANPAICTARVEQWILRRGRYSEDLAHKLENVDLASLARAYGIEFQESHHALQDAFVTAQLWQRQIHRLSALKVETLTELLKVAGV